MTLRGSSARVFAVLAVWVVAKATATPAPVSAATAALAVLTIPGLLIERLMFGSAYPFGRASAPARWVTWSSALVAVIGFVASVCGGGIGAVLLVLALTSLALALPERRLALPTASSAETEQLGVDEKIARSSLVLLVAVLIILAATVANVARDRMWYLAFLTRIADGGAIDWADPFFGTGIVASRFAYNDWLLMMSAWSALGSVTTPLVFERLAPPVLCLVVASASWHFASRVLPRIAGFATLGAVATMVATAYPFFSPDRYPFFARIAEDKTVALLVFLPVAMAAVLEFVRKERVLAAAAAWTSLVLGVLAVGFGHALVALLLCIAIAMLVVLAGTSGEIDRRRALAALFVTAILVTVPGWMALDARSRIVDSETPSAAWKQDKTHPVVRAHLRMERLRNVDTGGPVVDPELIAEPLLVLGVLGVLGALASRNTAGVALLLAMSVPFLVVAFVPFVSPLFGRLVLPWMTYRALWMIPFGVLAASLFAAEKPRQWMVPLRAVCALALVVHAMGALPERRRAPVVVAPDFSQSLAGDPGGERLLAMIRALPDSVVIAAAPGFAELVPALAGRHVLAFADRGTFVFAKSRAEAEERLQGTAVIVGLAPGSPALRRSAATALGVTHSVLPRRHCGRFGREVGRSDALVLCENHPFSVGPYRAMTAAAKSIVVPRTTTKTLASLDDSVSCVPEPELDGGARNPAIRRWRRESRWTARPVSVDCRIQLTDPASRPVVRIAADLPRAREAIAYRAVIRTTAGRRSVVRGISHLDDRGVADFELPGELVRTVRLRLAPAYLPYLNLRQLALRD